ncbi:GNAT family N-acetyltransferase [uncultured Shimia sp.]|uniref:GNAT family N-acetyltransferase n=1 Tax=uncultured Shimia sp. TaxID=573152 RepID=UPI00261B87BC|nr:GNAT family N-acetyltransferase [uncultured Shimia sp.]
MDGDPIEITLHQSLDSIPATDWDACADPSPSETGRAENPFVTHRFLRALEESGSVGSGTGWLPRHLTAKAGGEVIAVAPMYIKQHSQGEYVFDHNWAHAYEQAGGRYYPKLQTAVPFSPVTGRRLLTRPGWEATGQSALVQGMVQVGTDNGLSGAHITFCTEEEAQNGQEMGLLYRTGQQFHWLNDTYANFDAFLDALSSRKRKNIHKERAQAQAFGGSITCLTGADIQPHHWDALWRFYQDTGARKWGAPYLTRAFFDILHQTMRDDTLLIFAERDGAPVAGAMNMIGSDTLFGRYWGCVEHHPALHFELCYYQAMDWAIAQGLSSVEAGAQGEHKLARGYLPVTTHSLHWIQDPGFRDAIDRYLQEERAAISQDVEVLTSYGPFKRGNEEDHE